VGWLTLTEDTDRMQDAVKTTSTHRVHKLRGIFILFKFLFFYFIFLCIYFICLFFIIARLLASLEGLGVMKLDVILTQ
jgi:hypothetical protein